MSDLTGTEAFEHVVAQLIDQVADRTRDTDKRRTAEAERNDAIRDLANLKQELGVATTSLANYRGADDAFIALYNAVEKAIPALAGWGSAKGVKLSNDLHDGLAAAKKFIDPIPF